MIHADLALARRIEHAGVAIVENYARSHAALSPATDIEILPIPSGGVAVFAGVGSPMSQVNGMGMDGPVDESEIERIEELYFRPGAKPQIVVCPLSDASVLEILRKRGYRVIEFENVLVGPVENAAATSTDIEIAVVKPGEENLYAETIGPNFHPDGILTPENRDMMVAMFGMSNGTALLAKIDGQAVGGGTLWIQDKIAWLAGGATLPPFRNRGIQTALFHARMEMAREAGCDLVEMGSSPGSQSQRNAERRGLQVIYTKVVMTRDSL